MRNTSMFGRFVLFLLLIVSFITGCGQKPAETVWVYDTNQYQVYRRLSVLCANAIPDGQITEISENELTYRGEQISLSIKTEGEETVFTAHTEDGQLHKFTFNERPAGEILNTGIKAAYVDVTGDGNKDIIVMFSPIRGTFTGPGGAYLYDVAEDKELKLLDNNLYLSEEMLEDIEMLLNEDFYDSFPEFGDVKGLNAGGMLYADDFGNLYYETCVTDKTAQKELGAMMLFLTYEKETGEFSVSDIMYMPYYITMK